MVARHTRGDMYRDEKLPCAQLWCLGEKNVSEVGVVTNH